MFAPRWEMRSDLVHSSHWVWTSINALIPYFRTVILTWFSPESPTPKGSYPKRHEQEKCRSLSRIFPCSCQRRFHTKVFIIIEKHWPYWVTRIQPLGTYEPANNLQVPSLLHHDIMIWTFWKFLSSLLRYSLDGRPWSWISVQTAARNWSVFFTVIFRVKAHRAGVAKKFTGKSKFSTKLLGNLGYTRSTNSGHRSETKFVKTFYWAVLR